MSTSGPRVLIVDDDPDIRANFDDILSELGYRTECAENAAVALECVRRQHFDVVLLDYKMPDLDGATLYKRIREVCPDVAAFMITAWAGSDGAQVARDAGTWDVFRKPVHLPTLLQQIECATKSPVVLVIDDDHDFCNALWEVFRERRIRVALAHTEDEGIDRASSGRYDVAIVDLKLGDGDGLNVLRRIDQSMPRSKTVVVSGHLESIEALPVDHDLKSVRAILPKPLDLNQLIETIGSI